MPDTKAIDKVLEEAVASGQVPGVTAAAANADHGGDDRNFQSHDLAQILGDGFSLPPFFRVDAGISAIRIDQREDGPVKFFRNLHDAQRLAVTLRMRRAKIAVDALLHVASLLRADD